MTNTKFRKRALLSSVAMLLVALVALGSATFAWFTSSSSAKAEGLAIATTKSSELKVSKADWDWQDSVEYDDEAGTYVPTTSADGANWYTNSAATKTEFTAGAAYAPASNLSGVVYKEMFNVKNVGQQTASGVTVTVAGTFASTFGRIAIIPVEVAENTSLSTITWSKTDFSGNIYGNAASDTWKPYNGTALETSNYSTAAAASGKTFSLGDMAAGDVKSYVILVWFEGEDADCFDLTTSALTIGSATALSFNVSTT